jgi:hypothetical protein
MSGSPVRRVLWPLMVAAFVAGCGLLPTGLPDWVVNRKPLPACGEEQLVRGDTNLEARQCLFDAFDAGRDAELISTEAITEGREVTRYMRVHENGTIEIFTDTTRDTLQAGGWKRETCGQMLSAEDVRDVWIEEVFIILGCEEQPIP